MHSFKERLYRKSIIEKQVSSKKSVIFLFGLIITCSIFYLWQINGMATKGYQIKDLEDKVSELRQKNKKLELNITELRSTERITKGVETLKMVNVARVEYLKTDGSTVAMNR